MADEGAEAEKSLNGMTSQKRILMLALLVLISAVGIYAINEIAKTRFDETDPEMQGFNLPDEISPGGTLMINFTATDMDAKGRILPENIAHASVRVTGNGYDENKTANRLDGNLFSGKFWNFTNEGEYDVNVVVRDGAGNFAEIDGSFKVRDRSPTIDSFLVCPANIEVEGIGEFTVALKGKDDVGVAAAQAQIESPNGTMKEVSMSYNGTHYVTDVPGSKKGVYDFIATLEDTKGQRVSAGPMSGEVRYSYLDKLVMDVGGRGIKERTAVEYYERHRGIVENLYDKDFIGLVRVLEAGDENSTSNFDKNPSNIITDIVYRDDRIPIEMKNGVLVEFAGLLNDLNVTGFRHMETYHSAGNYTHALQRYSRHTDDEVSRFLGMSEKQPVVIQSLVLRGVDGQEFRFEDDIPRNMWMICELAKQRQYIVDRPEMFEGIYTQFVPSVGWSICDYGPSFYDGVSYSADDPAIWNNIILPFFDYMADPHLGKSDRVFVYPIFNSTAAEQYISDRTNRVLAGWLLSELPGRTVDKRADEPGTIITGIEGTKLFVEQLPEEYERIHQAMIDYPTNTPDGSAGDPNNPRWWWWQWYNDRRNHGLVYTVEKFLKIDDVLSENWSTWDIIKFVHSYERCHCSDYAGEPPMYRFGLPLGFKSFGIPSSETSYKPRKAGAGSSEWSVSIPDTAIDILSFIRTNDRIVIGHGNMLSLFSAVDGAEKDGVEEIFQVYRNKWPIYNWLKD